MNGSSLWYRNGVLVLLFAVKGGVGIGQEELKRHGKERAQKDALLFLVLPSLGYPFSLRTVSSFYIPLERL